PETDAIVERVSVLPGVHGARQIGGGFGGAVLALVEDRDAEAVRREAATLVPASAAPAFICSIVGGAGEVTA
ncbi:MAG: hypothetical protein ACREEQ_04490, partial [Caulobacteraceae bacterium]